MEKPLQKAILTLLRKEEVKQLLRVAAPYSPYFHSAIGLPDNTARECVALFVLLILFMTNMLHFLPSNNSPFCLGRGSLCVCGEKKGIWYLGVVPVFTLAFQRFHLCLHSKKM